MDGKMHTLMDGLWEDGSQSVFNIRYSDYIHSWMVNR